MLVVELDNTAGPYLPNVCSVCDTALLFSNFCWYQFFWLFVEEDLRLQDLGSWRCSRASMEQQRKPWCLCAAPSALAVAAMLMIPLQAACRTPFSLSTWSEPPGGFLQ